MRSVLRPLLWPRTAEATFRQAPRLLQAVLRSVLRAGLLRTGLLRTGWVLQVSERALSDVDRH